MVYGVHGTLLLGVVATFPYTIHTVLTDNGVCFVELPKDRERSIRYESEHIFDRICKAHGIEHRLTRHRYPWTNGQAERVNRMVKATYTIKAFHYPGPDFLRARVPAFVTAQDLAKYLCMRWASGRHFRRSVTLG